ALGYCHAQGVIHRDVKPQNVIIRPEGGAVGGAVLVDFGLVKLWDPRDPRTKTAMRGMGTPEYAPPEQYDIEMGHTDARSDIYSLGATLYHALTGQAPPTATQRMASPSSFIPPRRINPTLSPAIEAAVLKALEMAMERRYQSVGEMAQALEGAPRPALVTPEGGLVTPTAEVRPAPRRRPDLWIGLALAGLFCLMLAAGGGIVAYVVSRVTPTPTMLVAVQPTATPIPIPTSTPVSTSTSIPTSTPHPASTPVSGNISLQDDFNDPGSGWEVGDYETGSVGYKGGVYFVTSLGNGDTMWGAANRAFDNLIIEVDATQVSAPANNNNDYGVICRLQPNGDGYYLLISGDGYYAIAKAIDGDFEWLVNWTESDVIRQGNATNHIRAVCDGSTLLLFVNGQRLATAEDGTFARGDIALTATSYEDEPSEIHFDRLVVRKP
nr:hypothetical protein [Anaerolineae bacterium]